MDGLSRELGESGQAPARPAQVLQGPLLPCQTGAPLGLPVGLGEPTHPREEKLPKVREPDDGAETGYARSQTQVALGDLCCLL